MLLSSTLFSFNAQAASRYDQFCQHSESFIKLLGSVENFVVGNSLGKGVGVELEGTLTAGAGGSVFTTVEALNLQNKIALYCAMGGRLWTGGDIGISGTITGISSYGCVKASDYEGLFLSGGVSGSIAPIGIGGAINIGIALSFSDLWNLYQELTSGSTPSLPKLINLRHRVARTMGVVIDALYSGVSKKRLARMSAQDLKNIFTAALYSPLLLTREDRIIIEFMLNRFTGCNSLSGEIGLAAEEGISDGLGMSNYKLLDNSLSIDQIRSSKLRLLRKMLSKTCHGNQPENELGWRDAFAFYGVNVADAPTYLRMIKNISVNMSGCFVGI